MNEHNITTNNIHEAYDISINKNIDNKFVDILKLGVTYFKFEVNRLNITDENEFNSRIKEIDQIIKIMFNRLYV